MKQHTYLPVIVMTFVSMFCNAAIGATPVNVDAGVAEWSGLTDYPRTEHFEQGTVQVDFPTLESWPQFRFLRAWLPVEVRLNADSKSRVGSVYVQAVTDINFDQRTVSIGNLEVLKTKIPGETESETVTQLVSLAFQGRESTIPLDVLLRLLPEDFEIPGLAGNKARLNFDPPVILVSETPLKLLSIDKEPIRAPIEEAGLEYVVNSDWSVFYYPQEERWYVLNDKTWQQNNYLSDGGWTTTDKLPADFDKLALDDHWGEIHESLPASKASNPPIPFVISLQATELVLTDGTPRLDSIDQTGISYVSNTQSDLFSYGERWYFLVSGRWFSNASLNGQWQFVKNLPAAFAQIPTNHKKAHVLYSVPGTRQAKLALIEAALPHRVSIEKNAASKLEVNWVGEPRFEAIENTSLQRGLNTPFQVIKHNNYHYLCYEGAWYFSSSANGPWKVALQIPDEIYQIPATDPAYNVTFVRMDTHQEEADDHVNYSYSSGYTGSFSTTVSVVYGTGWHYPSSVYWDPWNRPVYWHYASTYGYNTGYHPVGAYYGGRAGFYSPWGGWGGWGGYSTVTLTSPSVDFTHGYGSAWEGPLQTTPGDPSETGEKSLDEFLPKKKIDGTEEFVKTSKDTTEKPAAVSASSLYAGSMLTSTKYSGPDGEVYKRENDEWSQYSEGNWNTMQAMEQEYRSGTRPQQNRETRDGERWLPAHKRTLSRSELDQQELARLEGMETYSKYKMEKESDQK